MCEFIGIEVNRCESHTCLTYVGHLAAQAQADAEFVKRERDGFEQRLAHAEAMWLKHEQAANIAQAQLEQAKAELAEVKDWLKEARAGWSGSDSEFAEAYGELAEMLGVEFTEEVELSVRITQIIKVRKTIGIDIDHNDLYARSYVHLYSNDEDNVEVLDHSSDAIIDQVEAY